jgi:hypothetical protein
MVVRDCVAAWQVHDMPTEDEEEEEEEEGWKQNRRERER